MANNKLYDNVFRTIVEKMPELIISLVNEIFGTNYPDDEKIVKLKNEHVNLSENVTTDAVFLIAGKIYHIEWQSTNDNTMGFRTFNYGCEISKEFADKENKFQMVFPNSCVVYLRNFPNVSDCLEGVIDFPKGQRIEYSVPAVKVQNFSKDDIFKKNLLIFLPFYVMRYENNKALQKGDAKELEKFLKECESIRNYLEEKYKDKEKAGKYIDIVNMIIKISDHVFRKSEMAKKGLGDIMGGIVLKLKSEQLLDQGRAEGIKKGRAEGIKTGRTEGENKLGILISALLNEGKMKEAQMVAEDSNMRQKYYKLYNIK